ncbi:hypothetical protein [Thermomonas fusca]
MRVLPRWLLRAAQCLGILWASPVSLIGLAAGFAALAGGARMQVSRRDLACIFHRVPWGPGGALTLGNVILDTGDDLGRSCNTYAHDAGHGHEPRIRLCDHERAHVLQYMALGALFLPLYLLHGGVVARNPFERAADRYARTGRGWWPWLRD